MTVNVGCVRTMFLCDSIVLHLLSNTSAYNLLMFAFNLDFKQMTCPIIISLIL